MIPNFKKKILGFLEHQKGQQPGYFKFSYSGDLYGENKHWGLPASAFAAKIYQMLGALETLPISEKEAWAGFVRSFENSQGEIADPLVLKKSFWPNKLSALRRGYFGNFFSQETILAETKQAWATLEILGAKPLKPYQNLSKNEKEILKYLQKLNWSKNPWNAASHVAQLLFFYDRLARWFNQETSNLIRTVLTRLESYRSKDGSWHLNPNIPNYSKVNAAMKIITGLATIKQTQFSNPEGLIDLCLAERADKESCSKVDRIYVLYYASRLTDYRRADVLTFAKEKLQQYEASFKPEGGFSFYPNKAQYYYLGARVSKGLDEPDLHGTVLGVWGYVLLLKLLELPEEKEYTLPTV